MAETANPHHYRGRFAPSPSGPLHAGSLLAAVASFLDARAAGGQWLLRIEDVDRHRSSTSAEYAICQTLEQHQLYWDGAILYQREREPSYHQALEQLARSGHIFYCDCRRSDLRKTGGIYPGTCRSRRSAKYRPACTHQPASHAIRFDVRTAGEATPRIDDRIYGSIQFDLNQLGDFIIRRRDSLFAYQLAVVVDDIEQGISDIVRGSDLLESTPWQLALLDALDAQRPRYAHLPLLIHTHDNSKLSKQTGAQAIDNSQAHANLVTALKQLRQPLNAHVEQMSVSELLSNAITNWDITRIKKANIPFKTDT